MSRRSYGQYCALAKAFDVIGERWTPLLIRELAMGPQRYADLVEGLPGIGTALLAQRLKDLEADGVVERRFLAPPAARWVYDLTDDGRELAEALLPLARWGAKRLGIPAKDDELRLGWFLLYLQAIADPALTIGWHDTYEFHVGDQVFHFTAEDGHVDAKAGPAPRPPNLVVRTDLGTFVGIGTGKVRPGDPAFAERMVVEGDSDAAMHCLQLLAPAAIVGEDEHAPVARATS